MTPRARPQAATSEPLDTAEHVLWLLKRAWHQGHRVVGEAVRPYGVTPTEMGALHRLTLEPGLSGAQLARRLLVTPQAAQLAITALEDRGLVERKPDPSHGRIVRAFLTTEGRRVARLSLARSIDAEDRFLAALEPAERRALVGSLLKLVKQDASGGDAPGEGRG